MNLLFEILCIVHILIWVFILTAFLNKITAEFNLYYLIPFIYILHILPFHIITRMKEYTEPNNTEEKVQIYENGNILVTNFYKIRNFFSFSIFNPLSTQGLMIFGLITSAWALKLNNFAF